MSFQNLLLSVFLSLTPSLKGAQFKYSLIEFDSSGSPRAIVCTIGINPDLKVEPTCVLLAPDRISYSAAEIVSVSRKKGIALITIKLDLSKLWPSDLTKPLADGDWKLAEIGGKPKDIPDDDGFIKLMDVSTTMQVGLSLGRADLDPDVREFLKRLGSDENQRHGANTDFRSNNADPENEKASPPGEGESHQKK